MRQVFESEERGYLIDGARLMDFLEELTSEMDAERVRRSSGGQKPLYSLYVEPKEKQPPAESEQEFLERFAEALAGLSGLEDGHLGYLQESGRFTSPGEFFGRSLTIGIERSLPPMLETATLGKILVADDGSVFLSVYALDRLATDPGPLYSVAEKYALQQ